MFKLKCLLLPVLLLVASALHAVEPSFTPLPDLRGEGRFTFIAALSDDGEVVVGRSDVDDAYTPLPFRWTRDTGIVAVGDIEGAAMDVSADGKVIVGSHFANNSPRAFRWTDTEGIVQLKGLHPTSHSYAAGVSGDGMTVFGSSDREAVRWAADGEMMQLGAGQWSRAYLVSWDGSIAVGTRSEFQEEVFRWTATEGVVSLGQLPLEFDLTDYYPRDMTPDGRLIVGYASPIHGSPRGFRWTPDEGMVELGFFPFGVSDDGRVMVGHGPSGPAIWTEGAGLVELQPFLGSLGLDLAGWRLREVTAISGDGTTIAGLGTPPEPSMSGTWIATIPEPSTWALGGSALVVTVLGTLVRRRKR